MDKIAYTLDEVSDLTGFSVRQLKDGCRAKEIPHTRYRSTRVMTVDQIARFLAQLEVQAAATPVAPDVARIERHRQRVAARLAKKRGRTA